MRRGTQLILAGAALVFLAALSSTMRSTPPNGTSQRPSACCPWVAGLDGFCQKPGTNGSMLNNGTNLGTLTNQP